MSRLSLKLKFNQCEILTIGISPISREKDLLVTVWLVWKWHLWSSPPFLPTVAGVPRVASGKIESKKVGDLFDLSSPRRGQVFLWICSGGHALLTVFAVVPDTPLAMVLINGNSDF